ncbi:MAG: 50S ribosomal protein L31 [Chloroflexi bacterium]|nr:50S ribosomal protein L31 [Chloroflexota bacterium]
MKKGIHPKLVQSTVVCACGNSFQTLSVKPTLKVEICSHCHPFFTGTQRIVDTAGQVERFMRRMERAGRAGAAGASAPAQPAETTKAPEAAAEASEAATTEEEAANT